MVFSARPLRTLDNKLKLKLNKSGPSRLVQFECFDLSPSYTVH